ncbi:hypothetical protein [Accumulibacter sp.]|uniref:hypothetical protein n=1 Tax=Accumulibacter sp. TaxID=2053492 RepID=UPI00258006BE|nr:hypothetical protein [Accumulibacter sp.]
MLALQLLQEMDPEEILGVRLATIEGRHLHRRAVDAESELGKNALPLSGRAGKQAGGNHVMSLAATHGLLEAEDTLIAAAGQPLENLPKENLHALGHVILGKERVCFDAPRVEIRDVGNRVGSRPVEHALPDLAQVVETNVSWHH